MCTGALHVRERGSSTGWLLTKALTRRPGSTGSNSKRDRWDNPGEYMNEYQSFGAGVGSVALAEVINHKAEKVFSDPDCEQPETYVYLDNYPHQITTLHPVVDGCKTIEEWCHLRGRAPFSKYRECTRLWKVTPIRNYIKRPAVQYIGYTYDEAHRACLRDTREVVHRYPLVEQRIDRRQAVELIKDAGLDVPPKSGCWLCPLQPSASWWRLSRTHPDLFWRAVAVDELADNIRLRYKGIRRLWPPPQTLTGGPTPCAGSAPGEARSPQRP